MQFLVIARDHTDQEALDRRMANRQAHIEHCDAARDRGEQLTGIALLNDEGKMCGSVMLFEYPSRAELDEALKKEPYVTGNVWKDIEITNCKVGPSFEHLLAKKG